MTEDSNAKKHEKLIKIQQSEAKLHWQRNNVFLVVSSIFLLAISQFENLTIQFFISISGLILSIGWLLIQHRSSSYIKKWKNEAKLLEKSGSVPSVFSGDVRGIQMRHIAYLLPLLFISLWISMIIIFLS